MEGATGSCLRDFPAAEDARKAKERQRTMRTERNTGTGTANTTKNQGASPPAHRGRTKKSNSSKTMHSTPHRHRASLALLVLSVLCLAGSLGRAQTIVWSENFDDVNAINRWYLDNPDCGWTIGLPTYGPPTNSAGCRAYSCPNCATTGLNGNYPGASGTYIRLQSFLVPPANQFPRLRFWHWYSFNVGNCFGGNGQADYGVLKIKGTNGVWQEVSPRYYYSSGGWTCPSVDLSAYSGQTVQLGLYFGYVNSCGYTAPGWYVDNISLETGTPLLNCLESWNNGLGDWYASGGTWQVGVATKSGGAPTNSLGYQAYTGSNCAVTVLNASYPVSVYSSLVSPPFIVYPATTSPQLSFWHWYSFAVGNCFGGNGLPDYGQVYIAVGTNAPQPLGTIIGTYPQYTGTIARWSQAKYDLSPYVGQTVQVFFSMNYANSCGYTAPGWYVDDVQVTPCPSSAFPPCLMINSSRTNMITKWTCLPSYTRFILQSSTNLASTNWSTVSPAPVVVSGQNIVTNPISGTKKFFRLKQ